MIGAVSPAGGDISEPVCQATLRIVKVFWALDAALAYKRHFPAINWLTSYSLYLDNVEQFFTDNTTGGDWESLRADIMRLLQEEAELDEIVKMVGMDALSAPDRIKLEAARSIREDYLHQNAFDEVDTYTSIEKQHTMMKLILAYFNGATEALSEGAKVSDLVKLPCREAIGRFKYVAEADIQAEYDKIIGALKAECAEAVSKKEEF